MKHSVMFVDDEESVIESLRRNFRKSEFEVRTANDAASALSSLEAHPVDLVVSDHCMPGMTGVELLCQIRDRWPDTMRIILTGQADQNATIQAVNQARVFRFLTKPCCFKELESTILEALVARDHSLEAKKSPNLDKGNRLEARRLFEEEFEGVWMAYQPLVFAHSSGIAGYEALVRAPGLVPPALFDLARAAEMQPRLESRIWEQIAADIPNAPPGMTIFANVDPEALSTSELFEHDFPLNRFATQVVLEITERAPLDSIVDLSEKIADLRARGFRIALDDLGAGFAGLSTFASLNPDIVKFDMDLVQGFRESPTHQKLISSISKLCTDLGIRSVAEGIETEDQARGLTALGCDLLQGFYFGRPEKPFVGIDSER